MSFDVLNTEIKDFPPLHLALLNRDFDKASSHIREGFQLDDIIEDDGNSFLHDASQEGDAEMVDFFLSHDCPLTLEKFDYISQTPLIRASSHGHTDIVQKLLNVGVDPNAHDAKRVGNTAIKEAVSGGHIDIVSILIGKGADPTIPGWMSITAVDQAWYKVNGSRDVIRSIRSLLKGYPSSLRDKEST